MITKPFARVTWIDSMIVDRYVPEENGALKLCEITSIGYVLEDTDVHLALARDEHNGVWRGVIVIPKFAVTSRSVLRLR